MWLETKNGLYKEFTFKDFHEAFEFMKRVAVIADEANHHPHWENTWNKVFIWLSTHSANDAITQQDYELSKKIDLVVDVEVESLVDKNTTHILTEVKLYADGGSRGNPGPSASGYVILDSDGNVIAEQGIYLGITTNNQAEYQALKLGLENCLSLNIRTVHVYMDSMLVVNQMKSIFKVKNRDLWPIHDSIKVLLPKFKEVTFTHVPRELNKLADTEVNKALDAQLKLQ